MHDQKVLVVTKAVLPVGLHLVVSKPIFWYPAWMYGYFLGIRTAFTKG